MSIKNLVTKMASKGAILAQKKGPTAMVIIGGIGVVFGVVCACKATLKLADKVDEAEKRLDDAHKLADKVETGEITEKEYKKAVTKAVVTNITEFAKLYGVSSAVLLSSLSLIGFGHGIKCAQFATATGALAQALDENTRLREKIAKVIGSKEDANRVVNGIITEEKDEEGNDISENDRINYIGADDLGYSMYARFFDETSTEWTKNPETNMLIIKSVLEAMRNRLHTVGYVFLNEVYDALGLEKTKAGQFVGWIDPSYISKHGSCSERRKGDSEINFYIYRNALGNTGNSAAVRRFINGYEPSVLLDFNCYEIIDYI